MTSKNHQLDFEVAVSNDRNFVQLQRQFERILPGLIGTVRDAEAGDDYDRALAEACGKIHDQVGAAAFGAYMLGSADGANEYARKGADKLRVLAADANHVIRSWRGLALCGWISVLLTNVTWYFFYG